MQKIKDRINILRPGKRAPRETKTVIAISGEDARLNNNNTKQMDTLNMTDIKIVSTLDRNPKRLPRSDHIHSTHETTTGDLERFRNDPLYKPGPYQSRAYHQSHHGGVLREPRHEKEKRIARSEYMVTWRQSIDHSLSAKITDPSELSKPKKIEDIKDVQRLIIEDENKKIKDLPSSLATLSKVSDMSVKYSKIKTLPQWMTTMKNVVKLSITETSLSKIEVICQMTQLKKLDLSMNKLAVIPKHIQLLVDLTDLKVTGNYIVSLPMEIQHLRKLETLDASSNKLQSLPNEICKLRSLRSLDLTRNILEKLPEGFGNLEGLSYLSLSYNRLSSLPGSMHKLHNLRHITVANNRLKSIPKGMEQLINLEHLNMRNNEISHIEEFPKYVKYALLDMNLLKDVEVIGRKAERLEVLSVKDNELKHISKSVAENKRLKSLYIDGNPVENIPSEVGDITQLRHLTLNKTKLRELPGNLTTGRNRLSLLDVQDTRLSDEVIKSSTKGIEPEVVYNNLKRANRNSGAIKATEED